MVITPSLKGGRGEGLLLIQQPCIQDGDGCHGFHDGHRTGEDTGVVTTARVDGDRIAMNVDGLLGAE